MIPVTDPKAREIRLIKSAGVQAGMPEQFGKVAQRWPRTQRASRGARRLGGLLALLALVILASAALARAEGITNGGDDLRDGWYPEQSSLTPQLVSGNTFGQLWSASVEGSVYAQPLYFNGNVLIATEKNKVYSLNSATGAMNWSQPLSLGTPWNPNDLSCGDLTPSIGVTATPVIDTSTNTAYLTHKTYVSGTSGAARWYMDAVDLSTGVEKTGFPVELSGAAQNQPSMTFNPTNQMQRPGLLLLNGVVYASFGSHCDRNSWQGWVFGVSTAGQVKARWVDLPSGTGGGIWMAGSGLVSDGTGTILLSTGNGGSPTTPAAASSPPATLGEAIVRLAVQSDGTLKAVNFFAPYNSKELDEKDLDFASSGISALNDNYFGTLTYPHLAVAAGKEGYVYLLNRESLGGFQQGSGGGDKVLQRIGPYGGVWSRPGIWPGEGGWIYIPSSYSGGALRVYKYGLSGSGEPTLSLQGTSTDAFGFSSSAAVITSNATTAGSALVWIVWTSGATGEGGQLRAYNPVPVEGHPVLRWSAPIGTSSKFATPGVGGGRIYVGNREGKVFGFGSPVTAPLTGPATEFPTTTIGASSEKTVTLTATASLTVNKLTTTSSQFSVTSTSPALPATLSSGQTIKVGVKFSPTQTGPVGGALNAETSQGSGSFSLSGTGQASGPDLSTSPPTIAFGGVAVGETSSGSATFSNVGSAPLKINAETVPAAPFAASGMPAVGSEIAPGASVTVTVTYHPTAEGSFHDEVGLETTGGNGAVPVSGSAGPPGVLKITSESNEYGEVAVGQTATKSFTISNVGGTNVSITKSKPPVGGEFAATTTLPEGTTIAPGETLSEKVTFTPTAAGAANGLWVINGDDATGLHEVKFSGLGTGTFGKTAIGSYSDYFVAERKRVSSYAVAGAGSVSKLSIYLAPTGTVGQQALKGVIYADSGGAPGALLGTSQQLTFSNTSATGWYDLTFGSPIKLPAAGNYWIGVITGATAGIAGFRYDTVANSRAYNNNSYASGPTNPFGAVTTDQEQTSLYATYVPSAAAAVPVNTAPPTITGTAQQGQTLTEHHGTWTNEPTGYAYQWQQCDSSGNSCKEISTPATQSYVVRAEDVGHTIRVQEVASNAGGNGAAATSSATAAVTAAPVPVNTSAPTITGTAQQGQTLTEHHGVWTNEPTGYAYQWQRCDSAGATCKAIGATGQTYVLGSEDVGHTIRVQETASNSFGAGSAASSSATAAVTPLAPTIVSAPTITGTAQQGQTLTEHHGTWTNTPTSYTYRWLQCDSLATSCLPISGAETQTYVLSPGDVGHRIEVQEVAINAGGGSSPSTSEPTAVVSAAAPATFGKTSVGASSDYFVAERKRVNRYALASAGSVTKLSVYLAPAGPSGQQALKGVIYADSGGAPAALLATSTQLTFSSTGAAGWYDLTFSSPVKLAAGNYWIGVITGAAAGIAGFRFDSVSGSRDYNNNSFASGPTNPFGAVTIDAEQMSVYATYTPG
jgi:iron transport multicopper oxidase